MFFIIFGTDMNQTTRKVYKKKKKTPSLIIRINKSDCSSRFVHDSAVLCNPSNQIVYTVSMKMFVQIKLIVSINYCTLMAQNNRENMIWLVFNTCRYISGILKQVYSSEHSKRYR